MSFRDLARIGVGVCMMYYPSLGLWGVRMGRTGWWEIFDMLGGLVSATLH